MHSKNDFFYCNFMRIYLRTTPNTEPVPVEYQTRLVGVIHKWIGKENALHGNLSLYSFSWLHGSRLKNASLEFSMGAKMFISFHSEAVIKQIICNIFNDPQMFCGMKVTDVQIADTPNLSKRTTFYCGSPILIKRQLQDGSTKQYNFTNTESAELLKETLLHKMALADLPTDETLDIKFDLSYPGKRLKLIKYHGIGNKASLCPVILNGEPETKLFAWNVGIGSSTGIGFGAIY